MSILTYNRALALIFDEVLGYPPCLAFEINMALSLLMCSLATRYQSCFMSELSILIDAGAFKKNYIRILFLYVVLFRRDLIYVLSTILDFLDRFDLPSAWLCTLYHFDTCFRRYYCLLLGLFRSTLFKASCFLRLEWRSIKFPLQ